MVAADEVECVGEQAGGRSNYELEAEIVVEGFDELRYNHHIVNEVENRLNRRETLFPSIL